MHWSCSIVLLWGWFTNDESSIWVICRLASNRTTRDLFICLYNQFHSGILGPTGSGTWIPGFTSKTNHVRHHFHLNYGDTEKVTLLSPLLVTLTYPIYSSCKVWRTDTSYPTYIKFLKLILWVIYMTNFIKMRSHCISLSISNNITNQKNAFLFAAKEVVWYFEAKNGKLCLVLLKVKWDASSRW